MRMLNAAKDALTGKAARTYLNSVLARYGEITALTLDSRACTIMAVCQLEGEKEAITIKVERYVIESEAEKRFVRIEAVSCSRPWLERLLLDHARERRFPLPAWAAAAL